MTGIDNRPLIKIARITVNASRLEEYKRILKEEMETSLRTEPDVQVLYAVSDNDRPHEFTILEIYKDQEAYDRHCNSPHLLKYFAETKDIVQKLTILEGTSLIEGIWMK